jgi:hypothetical protein
MQFGSPGLSSNYGKPPSKGAEEPRTGPPTLEDIIDPDSDLDALRVELSKVQVTESSERLHRPRPVLTGDEYAFYCLIRRAMKNCLVMPKVNLASLATPCAALPELQRRRMQREYRRRVVDFVVWDPDTLNVVCLVDLDGTASEEPSNEQRQQDALAGEAGYATVRLNRQDEYDVEFLRELVLEALDCLSSPERFIERRLKAVAGEPLPPAAPRGIRGVVRRSGAFYKRHPRARAASLFGVLLGVFLLAE